MFAVVEGRINRILGVFLSRSISIRRSVCGFSKRTLSTSSSSKRSSSRIWLSLWCSISTATRNPSRRNGESATGRVGDYMRASGRSRLSGRSGQKCLQQAFADLALAQFHSVHSVHSLSPSRHLAHSPSRFRPVPPAGGVTDRRKVERTRGLKLSTKNRLLRIRQLICSRSPVVA